jgi:YidC/Oxa1 family membrane protein insertase
MRTESGRPRTWATGLLGGGLAVLLCGSTCAQELAGDEPARIDSQSLSLEFAPGGARVVRWEACHPGCDQAGSTRTLFGGPGDAPPLEALVRGAAELDALTYDVRTEEADGTFVVRFVSRPFDGELRLEQIYRLPKHGYAGRLTMRVAGEGAAAFAANHSLAVRLRPGAAFRPAPAPGFAGSLERLRFVRESRAGFEELDRRDGELALDAGRWVGFRNRFWALMVRPYDNAQVVREGDALLMVLPPGSGEALELQFYSGPLRLDTLRAADPFLAGVLFQELWFWMRWLTLGLLLLWEGLARIVTVAGLAIILTSLAVKILMLPLTTVATRWQRDVNTKQSLLSPQIREIKSSSKGEERHRRILELYERSGVHPMFALKSLLGVAIQVPVFFAAYHMLGENFDLNGVAFLWIRDLALPDRLATLPFYVPFFGDGLNVLPFLMTGVTLLSSWAVDDPSLSPDLRARQRRNLYLMAAAFFALFYTFPAGMVLYWTTNNVIHLAKEARAGRLSWRRGRAVPKTGAGI